MIVTNSIDKKEDVALQLRRKCDWTRETCVHAYCVRPGTDIAFLHGCDNLCTSFFTASSFLLSFPLWFIVRCAFLSDDFTAVLMKHLFLPFRSSRAIFSAYLCLSSVTTISLCHYLLIRGSFFCVNLSWSVNTSYSYTLMRAVCLFAFIIATFDQ